MMGLRFGFLVYYNIPQSSEELRSEVMMAIQQKRITPPPSDDGFDMYGPSIYVVTEQYIKPTTQGTHFSLGSQKAPGWPGL